MAFRLNENQKIFFPLTAKDAEFYYLCAAEIIEKTNRECLTDSMTETEAKGCIKRVIRRKRPEMEKTPADVLRELRNWGWIGEKEAKTLTESTAVVTEECRVLVGAVNDLIAEPEPIDVSNLLLTMNSLAGSEDPLRRRRPYKFILLEMEKCTRDLYAQTIALSKNIRDLMALTRHIGTMKEYQEFSLDNEIVEGVLSDYFEAMKDGLVEMLILQIETNIRALKSVKEGGSPDRTNLRIGMIADCLKTENLSDITEAEVLVDQKLSELEDFIGITYRERMASVRRLFAGFEQRLAVRLKCIANGGYSTESLIDRVLTILSKSDEKTQSKILERIKEKMPLTDFSAMCAEQMTVRNIKREKEQSGWVEEKVFTQEEMEEDARIAYEAFYDPYSAEEAGKWLDRKLGRKKSVELSKELIEERGDFFRILAGSAYGNSGVIPFSIEAAEGKIQKEFGEISKAVIRRSDEKEQK